jgi:hypothetical protein
MGPFTFVIFDYYCLLTNNFSCSQVHAYFYTFAICYIQWYDYYFHWWKHK